MKQKITDYCLRMYYPPFTSVSFVFTVSADFND